MLPLDDRVTEVVREILAVLPAGCSWLVPVRDHDGTVVDFRIAATSGQVLIRTRHNTTNPDQATGYARRHPHFQVHQPAPPIINRTAVDPEPFTAGVGAGLWTRGR